MSGMQTQEEGWRRWLPWRRAQVDELASLRPALAAINDLEPALRRLEDGELAQRCRRLRRRAAAGEPPGERLCEAFALVREQARRSLGQRPYDVQILAGLALHEGKLVEMKTGEGKTLAAVAPMVLAALAGRGAHLLTFNDYLARRDAEWMGPIYRRLGLEVAAVTDGLSTDARRRAYAADVTYLTVKEAGFDLLRDGLALEPEERVQRPLCFALVDEADSILIDEARIPLVIAGNLDPPAEQLAELAALARRLELGVDFDTDQERRNLFFTDRGAARAEAALGCGNLFAPANVRLQAELRNAVVAEALLRRDVDYIVRRGRLELVDELTGRVAENRHWPDGLQAALEVKEGLTPQPEGRVLGSITIQHLLHHYRQLCGMTATARPAARELSEVYQLEVVAIPTHRPSIRVDYPDRYFATAGARRRAVVDEVARLHATGRPILVGTASVEESERLAAALAAAGIACQVLNAKNDALEAEIVAEAGALGAVTLSTNMAGRGTDIRLGGSAGQQHRQVAALGGLYVLGTHRHDSKRIDDQLRGRAGRQGDPGSSRFFSSLDDDLLQRHGIERLLPPALRRLVGEGDDELSYPAVEREVARAQRIADGQNGDIRRRLFSYSQVLETQRRQLDEERRQLLEGRIRPERLAARRPQRWAALAELAGEELLERVERRLTLLATDRCWSEHLTEMEALRDEVHLVQLDGRDPLTHYYRLAAAAYGELPERIEQALLESFDRLEITADGVDWEAEGLRGPSSTWTYLVSDQLPGDNTFLALATHASFGLWSVLLLWPLLLLWGLGTHFVRWRRRRKQRDS